MELRNSALQTIFYNWEKSEKKTLLPVQRSAGIKNAESGKVPKDKASENLCWPIYITTQLIKPKYLVLFPPTRQLSRNLTP